MSGSPERGSPDSTISLRQMILVDTCVGLVSPFLLVWFSRSWTAEDVLRNGVAGQTFAHAIGTLAHLGMWWAYPRLIGLPTWQRWFGVGALLTAATLIGCLAASALLYLTGFSATSFWRLFSSSFRFGILLTYLLGFGAAVFETLQKRLQVTTLELRTKELERERALKLASEAQLSSLESRIHPHFLFNTLNSISALIRADPQRAERLIERMAAVLRFSLDSSHLGGVLLSDELKVVADYLEIEKARFGTRLTYSIEVEDGVKHCEVPPLSIQTLVENSIKYAVSPRRAGGTIRVSGGRQLDELRLEVWDDGPGFSLSEIPGGHGLDNLRSRLDVRHGPAASLEVRREHGGTVVILQLPLTVRALEGGIPA